MPWKSVRRRGVVSVVALVFVAGCGDDGPRHIAFDPNWSAPVVDRTADFQFSQWSGGSFNATDLAFLPDGRALLTTKGDFDDGGLGKVMLLSADGQTARTILELPVCSQRERGLGGVEIHPDFPSNPHIYLYYTRQVADCSVYEWGSIPEGGTEYENRLSSFEFENDTIDPASEVVLLDGLEAGVAIHNGGGLEFMADGSLLVAVGEASLGAASRDIDRPTGKVLRIDVDAPRTGVPGNPFFDATDPTATRSLVYASGLRNPFRIAVDPQSGLIAVTDVGTAEYEEVNLIHPGADYGYPAIEGAGEVDGAVNPDVWYHHDAGCAAVIGAAWLPTGFVDDDSETSDFAFGDYVCPQIRVARFRGTELVELATITKPMGEMFITGITLGSDGALYVATRPGPVYRVAPDPLR